MKRIFWLSTSAISLTLLGLVFFQNSLIDDNDLSSQKSTNPSTNNPILAVSDTALRQQSQAVSPIEKAQQVWIENAITQQLAEVAHAYEENMRFPKYSKPLRSNDWNLLNPRPFIVKKIPLEVAENLSAAIVIDQYIINREQDLPIKVKVSGDLSHDTVQQVSVQIPTQGSTQPTQPLSLSQQSDHEVIYSGILPASSIASANSGEQKIIANIMFNHYKDAKISTVVKLADNAITLSHLGDSYIEGPHLMIPAHFDVQSAGNYRLQANLFDLNSMQPVSHLNSLFALTESENETVLKVHAVTLRAQGFSGPYLLRDINLTRPPVKPGDATGYGSSSKPNYEVRGFDLSHYSDEVYSNENNVKRLEFLNKMAINQ